tara:strand:+ start:310 stop:423 length:114 start_codon:yes stop_codon:yes gene_type:complete
MKYRGRYGKRGRPPLGWKPTPKPILTRKVGVFIILFN